MMRYVACVLLTAMAVVSGCKTAPPSRTGLEQQVLETERAFAKTMEDRDFAAFGKFLAPETVFFSDSGVLRGNQAVSTAWKAYFAQGPAPFSWTPEQAVVLDSGALALTTGPVYDSRGKRIATFNSIWRQDSPGVWRVVFDKGSEVCN